MYAAISEFYPDPNEIYEQGSASESSDEEFDPAKKCFEIAGILGIQPDGRTFRELIWMIQGKNEHLAAQFGESEEAAMPYNPAVLQGLSN